MARKDIEAGRAYVELLLKNYPAFVRGLDKAGDRLKTFGRSATMVGGAITAAGSAILLSFVRPIKAASDAAESMNRFLAVFGDQAQAAGKFADELADKVGRSGVEIRDSMSSFQGFFVGLGFGAEQARKMSQQMQSLALDFASFNNLSDEEAAGRFISALSGSSEVLDKFGVNIKAAAIEQELARMGIKKTTAQANEQEKSIARLNIIMRSMTDQGAVGDAVKTAGSFANRLKAVQSGAKDASIAIGNALLPVVTPLLDKAVGVVQAIRDWVKQNEQLFVSIAKVGVVIVGIGAAITAMGGAAIVAGAALSGMAAILGAIKLGFAVLLSPIGLVVAAVAGLATWFATSTEWGRQMVSSLAGWFGQLKSIAIKAFGAIGDALAAGNIKAAANVLWAALNLAWLKGTNSLREMWSDFRDFYIRTTTEMVFTAQRYWVNFVNSVKGLWATLENFSRSVGEAIGHWLSRSSDPALAADQDRAHEQAKQRIASEGVARIEALERERAESLKEIDAAAAIAQESRNQAYNEEIQKRKEALALAEKEFKAATEAARLASNNRRQKLKDAPGFEPGKFDLSSASIAKQVFGAFSANALLAGGGGQNKTEEQINKLREERKKADREILRALRQGGGLI